MALNINTNIAALKARQQLNRNSGLLQKSLERLSTGLRINWAADDAAGLAIADGLRMTAKGLAQAIRNANEGISLIKVADGALIEYGNILATIKEKVTQAANATQNASTRKAIQSDIQKLLQELDNIARTTEFNGQKVLSGAFVNKRFQIGSGSYVTATLSIRSAETNAVGGTKTAVMNLNTIGPVQLTLTNAQSGLSVTTEAVELYYNNNPDNGAGALANEINRYSGVTGVTAVAVVEVQSGQIQAGTISGLKINGVSIGDITVQAADADGALASAINAKKLETGVEATVTEDGRLVLTSLDGRAIKVEADSGLNSVLGRNAQEMSTLGYIRFIQKGVADFQIQGAGGTGIGADFTVDTNATVSLSGESVLEAGSTIKAGSFIEGGSVVGGDATLGSTMNATDNAVLVKAGSTIHWGSTLATGTVITGDIVVAGNYQNASNNDKVALQEDMLVKAGTVLKAGTVIGRGTVVYGSLAQALGVSDGSVIESATLNADVTLDTDIVLKYDAANNTQIAASSTIAAGSKLGADFTIGLTWNEGSTVTLNASASGSVTGVVTNDASITVTASATADTTTATFNEGSYIKAGTVFTFAPDANNNGYAVVSLAAGADVAVRYKLADGSVGYLTAGDSVTLNANSTSFTILDDIYLDSANASNDLIVKLVSTDTTAAGESLTVGFKADSLANFTWTLAGTQAGSGSLTVSDTSDTANATFNVETELARNTSLVAGTELKSGSKFGGEAYLRADVTTDARSVLAQGSVLEGDSVLKKGSVLNTEEVDLKSDTAITADTTLKAGTILRQDTLFKAGTVINEDMTFTTGPGGTGTTLNLTAGTVLTQDLYLASDTTLTQDLVLKGGSTIKADSRLKLAPLGEIGQVETRKLSDLNVLTYEGAQLALTIVEAAISDIDAIRGELGSVQVQLESTVANISVTYTNTRAAEAAIREVDFAEEVANFTKMQVLMQAGAFALAQANTIPQMAIQLLQG